MTTPNATPETLADVEALLFLRRTLESRDAHATAAQNAVARARRLILAMFRARPPENALEHELLRVCGDTTPTAPFL